MAFSDQPKTVGVAPGRQSAQQIGRAQAAKSGKNPAAAPTAGGSSGGKTKHAGKGPGGGRFISGSTGSSSDVKAVQRKVGAEADGKFGKHTEAAVRAFQRKHGLQVDGVVGRQTIAALAGDRNASEVKPGKLSSADANDLRKIRTAQTRRPARSTRKPMEDEKGYNWRTQGNGKRGVKLKDGSTRIVNGGQYDALKKEGKLKEELEESFDSRKHPHGAHGRFARTFNTPAPGAGASLFASTTGKAPPEVKPGLLGDAKLPSKRPQIAIDKARKRKLSEHELPAYVKPTPAQKASAEKATADIASGKVKDTFTAHTDANGKLTPERAALHEQIIQLQIRHAHSHVGENRAIFLAGGAASGKSTALNSGLVDVPPDAVTVNPDIVRTMLPEYRPLQGHDVERASARTHEEASMLAKALHARAELHGMHVIVDGVGGGPPGKFAGKVKKAQANGARVEVLHVTVPVETALAREAKRAKRTGRKVPEERLRAGHAESARTSQEIMRIPGVRARVIDNRSNAPVVVAEKSAAQRKYTVKSQELYREFLAKARAGSAG